MNTYFALSFSALGIFMIGMIAGYLSRGHDNYLKGRRDGRKVEREEHSDSQAMGMASEPVHKPQQLLTWRDPCFLGTNNGEHEWGQPVDDLYLQIGRIIPEGEHAYQCIACGVFKVE